MIHITMDAQAGAALRRQEVRKAVLVVLAQHKAVDAECSLLLTGDERIRALNLAYRGIDAATDVLSFPAGETDPETGAAYLGDVIVSVSRAAEQAHRFGHSLREEVLLLVIHGTLHLLGYDHGTPEEKQRMWQAQGEALAELDLPAGIQHE